MLLLLLQLKTILRKKMLNVYFGNKNEKFFQINLNSTIKEETELKSRCWFTLIELHHRCLTEFQIFLRFWICQGFKYTKVTQTSEKSLHYRYFDWVLNVPTIRICQGYREFYVNCILEIHCILDMHQFLNIPRLSIYHGS